MAYIIVLQLSITVSGPLPPFPQTLVKAGPLHHSEKNPALSKMNLGVNNSSESCHFCSEPSVMIRNLWALESPIFSESFDSFEISFYKKLGYLTLGIKQILFLQKGAKHYEISLSAMQEILETIKRKSPAVYWHPNTIYLSIFLLRTCIRIYQRTCYDSLTGSLRVKKPSTLHNTKLPTTIRLRL